jgi:hypothetical protein
VVSLKPGPDGQRRRKKVSGETKTEVRAKLAGTGLGAGLVSLHRISADISASLFSCSIQPRRVLPAEGGSWISVFGPWRKIKSS